MKLKRAIRYLRISTDRQSNFSIDGQDMQTKHWCDRNNVEIIDTFIDEGYSARNFDRPDMHRLNAFILKHYRTTDYLVVNAFDRFSREAGEAIVEIKRLQKKFAIKVVSVSEGVTFDADDPGSFFYAGLMLLKGEDEIIRNRNRINLGIYTAKTKEGRYLGAAPIGYKNSRDERKKPIIIIDEVKALIVRYVYSAYLNDVPFTEIYKHARKNLGYTYTSHSYIQKMLNNPVYAGLLKVNAYKDNPEAIVEATHEAIIDRHTWHMVQEKMNRKAKKPNQIISDEFPLRSVLLCHCGIGLTGASSRGAGGNYYPYYKCKVSGHNTLNATKAHHQLNEVWKHMSLSSDIVCAINDESESVFEQKMKDNSKLLNDYRKKIVAVETDLESTEKKWVRNQLSFESYQRLYSEFTNQRMGLNAQIEKLSQNQNDIWTILQKELTKLEDLSYVYTCADTLQKQQFIKLVFDNKLYYQDSTYRTSFIMPILSYNYLILKEKQLLILDEKRGLSCESPLRWS